jgi:tetratricopeptide (TPR) repeat protein
MSPFFDRLRRLKTTAPSAREEFDALFAAASSAAATLDFPRAIQLYDQAIALDPLNAVAFYKRGNALKNLGRLDAAVASYDKAIERKPDYAHAYCNRGVVQQSLGFASAALSSYDRATALDPTDVIAHCNRALLLQECSRWHEAIASYDRAIAIDPQSSEAHYNRSLTSLLLGDFASGWRGFEWRWHNAARLSIGARRHFQQPLWLGQESIAGKSLLLYCEQGLGDTLQFCRYAASSAALGAAVLLEVQPPLLDLLAGVQGASRVIATGSDLPPFDYQCPLMSLPLAFNTALDTIPAAKKYLHNDQGKVAQWRTRLGERKRPRVGLVWSGNPNNPVDKRRSIRLADWVAHLPPQFQYYSLQKDVPVEDQGVLHSSTMIFSFDDFSLDLFVNTAALCECMDVVISVDTSVAHLSGALGQRTWVILPFMPDWRWMLDRNDSPWYPTMTLYRQPAAGDWTDVFIRVAADLLREFRIAGTGECDPQASSFEVRS